MPLPAVISDRDVEFMADQLGVTTDKLRAALLDRQITISTPGKTGLADLLELHLNYERLAADLGIPVQKIEWFKRCCRCA